MSGAALNLTWTPPGPVSERFMASRQRVEALNGPIGSGKTTTVLMKLIRLAAQQEPSRRHRARDARGHEVPVRRTRHCVVRKTYRQLWTTTLPSWFLRVPRDVGHFTGSDGQPAHHRIPFQLPDGSVAEMEVDFVALGDNAVEDVLRGYEVTWFYLNEADLLPWEAYTYARGRAGRFPPMEDGGPTRYGVLMDMNAPEYNTEAFRYLFARSAAELAADGIALFVQPGGLDPGAENVANLPPGYYENQIKGQPDWYVQRMVHNRPGYSRAGRPVYPEFRDTFHVAPADLAFLPGRKLRLGLDGGMSPAAAFTQRAASGQLRVLDELTTEQGTGPIRFGQMLNQRLRDRYPDAEIEAWADPSTVWGADTKAGEGSWLQIVAAQTGIRIAPGPTNKPIPRWEAVRRPLTLLIDGGPGFLLSPRCTVLREGFNAGYHFRKLNTADADRYHDEAEKNRFSHVHDALQYVASGGGEDREIRRRREDPAPAPDIVSPQPEWNPYA